MNVVHLEPVVAPLPGGELLHGPSFRRDAEEVRPAALLRGEVEAAGVRRPSGPPGIQVPVGGEVDGSGTFRGEPLVQPDHEQVAGASMVQTLFDDGVGADASRIGEKAAVG